MTTPYAHYITSKRLFLRELRQADVGENYYRWMNDPEVNRFLETKYVPQSLESISQYVASMNANSSEIFLAICLTESGRHIGNIKLGPINWIHRFADISLLIGDKSTWGKGYAAEAIAALAQHAFQKLNLHKLKAGCYAENLGSIKAFEKAGFTREGLLKSKRYLDGAYQDEVLLGLLNK